MYKEGEVSTVSKTFRQEDVTHKPKRFQGANITQSVAKSEEESVIPPSNRTYTLEGAIAYFEANSNLTIHKQVCVWLKEYREIKFGGKKTEITAEKEGEENE